MDLSDTAAAAVGNPDLSTEAVHRESRAPKPSAPVFPVVHTLYDYDERIER